MAKKSTNRSFAGLETQFSFEKANLPGEHQIHVVVIVERIVFVDPLAGSVDAAVGSFDDVV